MMGIEAAGFAGSAGVGKPEAKKNKSSTAEFFYFLHW